MYIQIVHLPGIPRAAFYIYTQIYLPGIPRAALCIILYRYKTYTQTCISLAFRGPQDHVSFPHSGSVAPFCFYISDQPRTARKSGSVSCRGVTTWWDLTKYHPTKRRWDLTTKSTRPPFAANGCAGQGPIIWNTVGAYYWPQGLAFCSGSFNKGVPGLLIQGRLIQGRF